MTHQDLQELLERVQLLDKPGYKKRFLTALDAYKSKAAPSPIESHECQSSENDQSRQREKPPSRHQFCVMMTRLPALLIDCEFC